LTAPLSLGFGRRNAPAGTAGCAGCSALPHAVSNAVSLGFGRRTRLSFRFTALALKPRAVSLGLSL
jgi:hypothetical protein